MENIFYHIFGTIFTFFMKILLLDSNRSKYFIRNLRQKILSIFSSNLHNIHDLQQNIYNTYVGKDRTKNSRLPFAESVIKLTAINQALVVPDGTEIKASREIKISFSGVLNHEFIFRVGGWRLLSPRRRRRVVRYRMVGDGGTTTTVRNGTASRR